MSITTIVHDIEEILRQLELFVSKLQNEVSIIESNPYEYLKSRIDSFYSFDTYLSDRKVITLENIKIDGIEINRVDKRNIKLNITPAESIDIYEETIPEFELDGVIKPITKGLEFARISTSTTIPSQIFNQRPNYTHYIRSISITELPYISRYFSYKDGLKIESTFINNKYHAHIYGNKLMFELNSLFAGNKLLQEEAYEVITNNLVDKLPITTDIKITIGGKYKKVISFFDICYNMVYLDDGTEIYNKSIQKIEDIIDSYLGNFDNVMYFVEKHTVNEILVCLYQKVSNDITIEIPIDLFIVHNKLHFEKLLEKIK